jgi:hypothetical protein
MIGTLNRQSLPSIIPHFHCDQSDDILTRISTLHHLSLNEIPDSPSIAGQLQSPIQLDAQAGFGSVKKLFGYADARPLVGDIPLDLGAVQ